MPVALLQEMPNNTLEIYDAVNDKLGVKGNPPEGLIFHTAGPMEGGGVRIFDVWESREAYERFRDERLLPAVMAVIGQPPTEPPSQTMYELHDFIKP